MKNEPSNLAQFKYYIENLVGEVFDDYESLWHWSINNTEIFWGSLLTYFDIIIHQPYIKVLTGEELHEKSWFSGMTLNYAEHVFRHSREDLPALYYQSETEPLRAISWMEMKRQTAAIQTFFKINGCEQGDRIAAILPHQPEASYSFFAANGIGAIWSSCSPEFGKLAIEERYSAIEPSFLIAVSHYQYGGKIFDKTEQIREIRVRIPSIKSIIWISESNFPLEPREIRWNTIQDLYQREELTFKPLSFNHPIYILFSSGTTGKPKAIIHRQGGILLEHLKYLALHNEVKKGDKYFWYTSTGWMMWNFLQSAFIVGAIPVMYNGNPTYPDEHVLWKLAEKTATNHFGTSPSYLTAISQKNLHPGYLYNLSSLRSISSTGSPLSVEHFDFVEKSFPHEIPFISMSGGTDVCTAFVGGCSLKPIIKGQIQARCLGAAVFSFSETGEKQIDIEGELVISKAMPSMPLGFWGDDDQSKIKRSYYDKFSGLWCHGDWVTITQQGGIIISGRSDATLNKFGIRIGTAEIYRSLQRISKITDGLIIHIKTGLTDSKLVLFVCLSEGVTLNEVLKRQIHQTLKEDYSPRHCPDEIYVLKEIPYTLSGKKIELPVKKLFEGEFPQNVLSKESLRNPASWDDLIVLYMEWKRKREINK
jgi:acetoacetyl-CoA synthetase